MSTKTDPLQSAKENFAQGNYQECLRLLTFAFEQDPNNRDCYQMASICLRQMNAEEEARLFENALSNYDKFQSFYELGYHFIDVGHDRLAIPMLERAFQLAPGNNDVGLDLAIALCSRFRPKEARDVILQCDITADFWMGYQFYWASLLCGIADGAEQFIKESRRLFLSQTATHEIKGALYALDKLDEFRLRLVLLGQPKPLIMHWHFIQYGSAILDYFDDRDGQNGLQVAGGRWVYVGVSYEQLAITLNKLKRYLEAIGRMPKLILSMSDRDSSIIANGASKIFNLPLTVISDPTSVGWEESLLVAANNWNYEGAAIERILKGQTVFAFNLNWLEKGPSTPDVVGMMSQYCTFPWSKDRLVVDPESGSRVEAPDDSRDAAEIAEEFGQQRDDVGADFDETLNFYKQNLLYLKGGRLGGSKRWRFITDSPVPGSYFC